MANRMVIAGGHSTKQVSEVTGYSCNWIREIAHRYNRQGAAGVGDRRHHNPGGQPLLNDEQQAHPSAKLRASLVQALQGPAPGGGGQWSGPKVAQWMSQLLERPIHPQRGWEDLRGLEYRWKVPRPQHVEADLATQQDWKKNSTKPTSSCNEPTPT